jgi:hypothetical protein
MRILLARQWNVNSAYTIAIIATRVKSPALIFPDLVAEVEEADGETAEDDGEVKPWEKGTLVGEEDFGLDTGGKGDALAWGLSLEIVACIKHAQKHSWVWRTGSGLEKRLCRHRDGVDGPHRGSKGALEEVLRMM